MNNGFYYHRISKNSEFFKAGGDQITIRAGSNIILATSLEISHFLNLGDLFLVRKVKTKCRLDCVSFNEALSVLNNHDENEQRYYLLSYCGKESTVKECKSIEEAMSSKRRMRAKKSDSDVVNGITEDIQIGYRSMMSTIEGSLMFDLFGDLWVAYPKLSVGLFESGY